MANGLDAKRLKKHAEKIRRVDSSLNRFWLLAGIEVDILKTGELDLPEDVLADLDWVVASVHSHFDLGEKKMTERLVAAISSGVVDCLGHPLGRRFGRREPIAVDFDRVLEACLEHGVALEINAQPERLDLPGHHAQRACEAGVRLTVSTDAHKPGGLDAMRFGVGQARRGWARAADVLNTMSLTDLRRLLDDR